MMPLPSPNALHDQSKSCCTSFWLSWLNKYSGDIDDAIGIPWPKMWCCISFWSSWPKKWNVAIDDTVDIMWHAHFFNCLDIMNTVVLLTWPLASHVADASSNSIKWLKKSYYISFWSSWTTNAMLLLMIPSGSCDILTGANSITWPRVMWCLVSFVFM